MRLRNRHGRPVDPVPFFVVVGLAFMILLSFGPLYGQALGLRLETAITLSTALFVVAGVGAYYWQVWTARPAGTNVPAAVRGERLFYLILVLVALVIVLSLPFVL
ncbi:hypothetical protein GS429_13665 [Natronorubrum sp. JWXQ-INN-674]|uniref:Uncharacterized protein n=1 Tax=Natronorubrum halalkaliphilum TaxID=2691917 RepID=A0A6B0VQ01_9EURY|nr:hypothetical protein [Natronorubrum halalkaliphilum]MXV63096.1 hypothetical protein [Natronorubrum halalkaliphilum]